MFFAAFVLSFVPAPSSVMLSQPAQLLKLSDRPFLPLKTSSFYPTPPQFLSFTNRRNAFVEVVP
jgi:hypothetical protein